MTSNEHSNSPWRQRAPYLVVVAVLLTLAGLTTGLALLPLGWWSTPVALTIAAAKAVLILGFFMRLRGSPPLLRVLVIAGLAWFTILLGGTLDDYLTRTWVGIPGK